jgi:tetratricopeptide (TPR) repeat protein
MADKDEHQWLSAVCSFDGHDYARAAEKLTKIVGQEKENVDRQSEGWFLLGEACRNLNDLRHAREAYRKCVECGARLTCRARYQLAMLDIDAGKIDEATQELEQNVKFLDHRDPDAEAEEKSRFALCSLLYQGATKLPANYRKVVQNLEGHIDHLSVTPEAVRARFQLADCYRQLTAQSTVNRYSLEKMSTDAHDHYLDVNRRYLTRAIAEFSKVEELIKDESLAALLTKKQRLEVPFIVAQCRFNLGEYDQALQKYDELAKKWGNTPEALFALSGAVQCYGGMGDHEHLRQRAEQIRDMLPKTVGLPEADRRKWQDWLTQISVSAPPHERDTGRKQPTTAPNDHGPQLNPASP